MIDPACDDILCRLHDIPDGGSRGFLRRRSTDRIFGVRQAEQVFVYLNACPHQWLPMNLEQHRFLSADRTEIMCYAHGARFDIRSGICTHGACPGAALIRIACRIEDGQVVISRLLPAHPDPAQA